MGELRKGISLFVFNWLLVPLFYLSSILVFVGNLLQILLKTSTMPAASIFLDILLIVIVSYFVNIKIVKAKKLTFVITQCVFGISVITLVVIALHAIARGILMDA